MTYALLLTEPPQIGEYTVWALAEGGTAEVFHATNTETKREYALKLAKAELLDRPGAMQAFREGMTIEASLVHPNIVHADFGGTHEQRPYFLMQLMEGGTLEDSERLRSSGEPERVLSLMLRITAAVEYAQKRGIFHCDLKPSNILLDEHGAPHVSDFGLARRVGTTNSTGGTSYEGGTRGWMAPEQIERKQLAEANQDGVSLAALARYPITGATDVFSLGVLLYWLLERALPFGDEKDAYEQRALTEALAALPAWSSKPAWQLRAIYQRALHKDWTQRYPSAAELLTDLQCVQAGGVPILPPSALGRALLWLRRPPRRALRAGAGLFFAISMAVVVSHFLRASVEARRRSLTNNGFVASGQAGAALLQLTEYSDRVRKVSLDGAILLVASSQGYTAEPPAVLKELSKQLDAAYVVARADGTVKAQWPPPRFGIRGQDYRFRDYYNGAAQLGERGVACGDRGVGTADCVYVTSAFASERDRLLYFGFSTPLFEPAPPSAPGETEPAKRRWIGVLVATITVDSVLGKLRVPKSESNYTTALLGPRGPERGERPPRAAHDDFVFLVHEGLTPGAEVHAASPCLAALGSGSEPGEQLQPRYALPCLSSDYTDPIAGFEGQWNAAFAPVGGTGYAVVVQTRAGVP